MEEPYKRICLQCGKELLYKSKQSYQQAVKNNSLCKSCGMKKVQKRNSDLSVLLEDSYETFYWIGFLLADGNFSDNRVRITLGIKDKEHLLKFARYIKYSTEVVETIINIATSSKNIEVVPKICEKFDIKSNKTYFPPKTIKTFSIDLQYCLLAGFIDGDGSIRNLTGRPDFSLVIKNHASWLHILQEFNELIDGTHNFTKIDNQGYAKLTISNSEVLKNLKSILEKYNLPLLSRKWDIINYEFVSKYITSRILKENVLKDLKENMSIKDICIKYEICKTTAYKIKNKL